MGPGLAVVEAALKSSSRSPSGGTNVPAISEDAVGEEAASLTSSRQASEATQSESEPGSEREVPPLESDANEWAPRTRTHRSALSPAHKPGIKVDVEDIIQATLDSLPDGFLLDEALRFRLCFDLLKLPQHYSDALGLGGHETLVLRVILLDKAFGTPDALVIRACLDGNLQFKRRRPGSKFLYQVERIVQQYIDQHYPPQTRGQATTFFTSLYRHVEGRLTGLGAFCVVCNAAHSVASLMPRPCNSCSFGYAQLGLGSTVDDIYGRPAVADLFISMATAASKCAESRRKLVFKDLPVDFISGDREPEWDKLAAALDKLPSVCQMAEQDDLAAYLQAACGTDHAFKLLRWVLNGNRGHLTPLQEGELCVEMRTPHQFYLCSTSPDRELAFSTRKAQTGSKFLFHGSTFFNWHNILHESLKNATGTSLEAWGHTYGAGIYLAGGSGLSAHYARAQGGWSNSIFGDSPRCLALCEVLMEAVEATAKGSIHVVKEEGAVMLRYLFVYADGESIPDVAAAALESHVRSHAEVVQAAIVGRGVCDPEAEGRGTKRAAESVATAPAAGGGGLGDLEAEGGAAKRGEEDVAMALWWFTQGRLR